MTLTAALPVDGTPLAGIAERLSRTGSFPALTVHAYPEGDPRHASVDASGAILLWGLEPHRARIGPLVAEGRDECLSCLSFWIDHNRPDAELWRALDPGDPPPVASYPWAPLIFQAIEAASGELLAETDGRFFIDLDPVSLTVERHRYQRSPVCEDCTPRPADDRGFADRAFQPAAKRGPHNYRARNTATAVAELRGNYVDYRVGLIRHMYQETGSSMLPMWGAETKLPGLSVSEVGYGRHETARAAEGVAILEALERFCGYAPRSRRASVRGSFAALRSAGEPVVDPRSFILSDPAQYSEPGYNLRPYSDDLECDWVWALSCRNKGPVLIPQQFAFYSGNLTPGRERFVLETSNGCALGGSFEEAVFHGLLEVIERDAYMTRWHVHGEPRRIDLADGGSPDTRRLHARATAEGYELHAFDIGLEIPVPTVMGMIVDPRKDAAVKSYCASGAHPHAAGAVFGALIEVCSSIPVYQRQFGEERERARALYEDSSLVQGMRDHVLLYSLPDAIERLGFVDRDGAAASIAGLFDERESLWLGDSLTDDLVRLIEEVCKVADDVIVIDQSANILDPMELSCVKVLAPGLHPITFGHQYRRISERRLRAARRHLAGKGEASVEGISPFPHNFP